MTWLQIGEAYGNEQIGEAYEDEFKELVSTNFRLSNDK